MAGAERVERSSFAEASEDGGEPRGGGRRSEIRGQRSEVMERGGWMARLVPRRAGATWVTEGIASKGREIEEGPEAKD